MNLVVSVLSPVNVSGMFIYGPVAPSSRFLYRSSIFNSSVFGSEGPPESKRYEVPDPSEPDPWEDPLSDPGVGGLNFFFFHISFLIFLLSFYNFRVVSLSLVLVRLSCVLEWRSFLRSLM